jgi:hypothetical protein
MSNEIKIFTGMLDALYKGFISMLILSIILISLLFSFIFDDNETIKTTSKPKITWELKAHGQKVDTIWIYKFN